VNKAFRLALLLGLALLASWSAAPKAAYAFPFCPNLDGSECPSPGAIIRCSRPGGSTGTCFCGQELTWACV